MLVWRFDGPRLVISSAPVGGGIGERRWVVNAQVRSGYDRTDLAAHVDDLAIAVGIGDADRRAGGVGMLTAADVTGAVPAHDEGVDVVASVGIRVPTWAAAPTGGDDPTLDPSAADELAAVGATRRRPDHDATGRPGTINVVALVPVPLSDAALVNLVATATEAKAQAMLDASIPGTGTATDAVCIVCPVPAPGIEAEPFGGPRSTWGARVARATYASVRAGIGHSLGVIAAGGPGR
jgi:adenosylcobinamide amidohydrolase